MIQALAALAGAALTSAGCCGAGALLLAILRIRLTRLEWIPLTFLLGAACLHLTMFLILAAHAGYWPVLVAVLIAAVVSGFYRGAPPVKSPDAGATSNGILYTLFYLIVGLFGVIYFLHALGPEGSPDGPTYHLGLIARYLHAHRFERITDNMYAGLGEGVEMVFLPAFAIGRHSAAALVHFTFALALAMAMAGYGRRIGKPLVGMAGAVLTFAAPVVGIDASSAYNDVAVAAIVFGTFYLLQIWDEERSTRTLVAVGLLAGYAYAAKYTAFVMLPFALGYVLWRTRQWKPILTVLAFAAVMITPWMLKDWIVFRNPVFPFANQVFRNPYRHVISEQQYSAYYRTYDLPNLAALPVEVTLRGETTQGVLGPIFLAAPLALLALRYRAGRRLLAAGAVVLTTYFANIGTRFLIPSLPFFSLSMAMALGDSAALLAIVMIFHAVTSWPGSMKYYAGANAWRLDGAQLRVALRRIPQDRYLREHDPAYSAARLLDTAVPPGERVLTFTPVADAYTARDVLVTFQGAFNETTGDILNNGWVVPYQPRLVHTFKFPEHQARRIRVLQYATGGPDSQWSVHELRFFYKGVEVARRPGWRLQAWPNPWDVQLAFDNSPATRWRSWEPIAPGMYIGADFDRAEMVDEVRLETSVDSRGTTEQVQVIDNSGNEVAMAGNPVETTVDPPAWIRRAATYEMAQRGVHYLLIHAGDPIADDIREDPEGWGLKQVAQADGVRLYRTE